MQTTLSILPLLAASVLATGCGAPDDGLDEDPSQLADGVKANGPIEIQTADPGVRFTDWGFDIKQSCSNGADPCLPPVAKQLAASPAWAAEIFGSGRMNVLRIPIRADGKGVDSNGNFDPSYYGLILQAAKNTLAVNPKVRIFASRSTVSDCPKGDASCADFAESLKEGNKASGDVLMWKYGRLLGQYLAWFDAHGVHVDILGPDNEPTNNEGNLAITRLEAAMESLDEHYGKKRPKLMLNDGSTPDIDFLGKVDALGKWPLVGFAGTHYQSDERATRHELLDEFAAFAHQVNKEVWDTEYHFTDNKPDDDKPGNLGEFADAALGVFGIFDQLDAGFSGIVWWAYRPPSEGTSKSEIQTALVETIGGAFPLATSDGDGPASRRSSLSTRAVHQGNDVVLWVVNDSGNDYPQKPIVLYKKNGNRIEVKKAPTWERWKRVDPTGGAMSHSSDAGKVVNGNASVGYPPHSITVVRIADVY